MAEKTLFEKICDREIPAEIVYEDDLCLAFKDISPVAPIHYLLVPKKPISRIATAEETDQSILGHLLLSAAKIARSEGFDRSGYRLIINNGPDAGEEVPHLHLHIVAGRKLNWPPG